MDEPLNSYLLKELLCVGASGKFDNPEPHGFAQPSHRLSPISTTSLTAAMSADGFGKEDWPASIILATACTLSAWRCDHSCEQ
jgi:hypothetical protein